MTLVLSCSESVAVQSCAGEPAVCSMTCTDPQWAVAPALLPPLSVGDSLLIAGAILSAWGLAVAFRMVRRFVSKR